ncbi:MAG: sel1 repeat family protein, partial [Alphaproteobacteria bacterium]|nr:sel1 repeat family protein [Alphaproteobacteria bacterium]
GITDANDIKAFKWLKKAGEKENTIAQSKLGFMYMTGRGVGGISAANDIEAFNWLTKAAKKENTEAQSNLGFMYAWGRDIEGETKANDIKAITWLIKAANKQNTQAQVMTGIMLMEGRVPDRVAQQVFGVTSQEYNIIAAYKCFVKAAAGGNKEAKILAKIIQDAYSIR